jgi:hypothetical protein
MSASAGCGHSVASGYVGEVPIADKLPKALSQSNRLATYYFTAAQAARKISENAA